MNEFSADISRGTHKRHRGMYLGEELKPEIKENRNILITLYPDEKSAFQARIGEYKRNTKYHKKGDPKFETHYRNWIQIYPNILKAWESVMTFPTVSWGLTCNQRNVFVVDVDNPVESLEKAEEYIKNIKNITPSYIIRNPSSGKFQFGYVLKEPIWVWDDNLKKGYNKLNKRLAKVFHSDECFVGPACKNPFYVGFESKIYRDENNNFKIYSIKDLKELFMLSGERDSDKLNLSQQSVAISSKELGLSSEEKNNLEEKNICELLFKYYLDNILISPFLFFFLYIITNNLVDLFSKNNLVDKVNSLQQIACTDGLALAKTDAQSDNHITTYMKLLRNKIFAYFRKNKQKLTDTNVLKQFEKETIQEMEEQGWVFNNMKQTLDATIRIQEWCNSKGWNSFYNNQKAETSIKDSFNRTKYGVNTRRKSLETRHNRKLEKISKFREWMSENESKVWRKRCKAKEGFLNLKDCAELVGISLQEFKQYLKLIDKGEITIERSEYGKEDKEATYSNRSNSEDELLQRGIAEDNRSPNRIETKVSGEEFDDSFLTETIEGRVSQFVGEIEETKAVS